MVSPSCSATAASSHPVTARSQKLRLSERSRCTTPPTPPGHLPHLDLYWLYVFAEVEVRQPPTNPAGAEQLPPNQAVGYLAPFMADTLRLVLEMSGRSWQLCS